MHRTDQRVSINRSLCRAIEENLGSHDRKVDLAPVRFVKEEQEFKVLPGGVQVHYRTAVGGKPCGIFQPPLARSRPGAGQGRGQGLRGPVTAEPAIACRFGRQAATFIGTAAAKD